jgi:hypothetical protein
MLTGAQKKEQMKGLFLFFDFPFFCCLVSTTVSYPVHNKKNEDFYGRKKNISTFATLKKTP